jgi:hypothetical protein
LHVFAWRLIRDPALDGDRQSPVRSSPFGAPSYQAHVFPHSPGESCSMGQNGEMGTETSGPGHKDLKFIPRPSERQLPETHREVTARFTVCGQPLVRQLMSLQEARERPRRADARRRLRGGARRDQLCVTSASVRTTRRNVNAVGAGRQAPLVRLSAADPLTLQCRSSSDRRRASARSAATPCQNRSGARS